MIRRTSSLGVWVGSALVAVLLWGVSGTAVAQGPLSGPGSSSQSSASSSSSADGESGDESEGDAKAEASSGEEGDSGEETTPVSTSRAGASGSGSSGPERDSQSGDGAEADEAGDDGDEAPADAEGYCDSFMVTHGESSARKLYRAVAGETYDIRRIDLGDRLELQMPGGESGERRTVRFEVHTENDDRSAALVAEERDYRHTIIVVDTDSGPIVTRQEWPDRSALGQKADCEPTQSWVEYPDVSANAVDIDPFDYWGIRVTWRIPSEFVKSESKWESLEAALQSVYGTDGE